MDFKAAEAWFANYRIGNETPEQTYERTRNSVNSMSWHESNEAAIIAIRVHRKITSATMDPMAFIQQFAFPKRPATATTTTSNPVSLLQNRSQEDVDSTQPGHQNESAEERKKRLNRERQQRYRQKRSEEEAERDRERIREQNRRSRSQETPQLRDARRSTDAVSHSQSRAAETEEERTQRLRAVAVSMSQHRAGETPEQRDERVQAVAVSMSQRRAEETPEERTQRLRAVADSMSQHRAVQTAEIRRQTQEIFQRADFDENAVTPHYLGPMNVICQFCGALHFKDEQPADKQFTNCCQKGKLLIPKPIINGVAQDYQIYYNF